MKYPGHPLVGDLLYLPDFPLSPHCHASKDGLSENFCRSGQSPEMLIHNTIKRQALHAYRLTFTHPVTGEHMILTAPIPKDMEQLIYGLT